LLLSQKTSGRYYEREEKSLLNDLAALPEDEWALLWKKKKSM
jgi:hypothetical protein